MIIIIRKCNILIIIVTHKYNIEHILPRSVFLSPQFHDTKNYCYLSFQNGKKLFLYFSRPHHIFLATSTGDVKNDKSQDKSICAGGTNPPTGNSFSRPRASSPRQCDITSRPHTGVLLTGFCATRSYVGTFALHNSLGIVRFDRVFVFGTAATRDIVKSFPDVFEHTLRYKYKLLILFTLKLFFSLAY